MSTKGEFLKEKMTNMARWVQREVEQEDLPADMIAGIADRSALEVTALAGALEANKSLVIHRDWSGLVRLLEEHRVLPELQEVLCLLCKRPELHSKFWRYMELFVEVSAQ
jgi:hypothetical protein